MNEGNEIWCDWKDSSCSQSGLLATGVLITTGPLF